MLLLNPMEMLRSLSTIAAYYGDSLHTLRIDRSYTAGAQMRAGPSHAQQSFQEQCTSAYMGAQRAHVRVLYAASDERRAVDNRGDVSKRHSRRDKMCPKIPCGCDDRPVTLRASGMLGRYINWQ